MYGQYLANRGNKAYTRGAKVLWVSRVLKVLTYKNAPCISTLSFSPATRMLRLSS